MGKKAAMPAADEEEAEKTQTAEEEEEAEEKEQEEEPAQEKPKKKKPRRKPKPKPLRKPRRKALRKPDRKAFRKALRKPLRKPLEAAPKATPKATPKAAPKAKTKANPDSPDTEKPKPRPKGKRTMAEALTEEWRNGLAPEKPEQEKEEEEEPDPKRLDRSKQNKPASMRKEWEALKTAGSRKSQSKFIEDMVVRDEGTGPFGLELRQGQPGGLSGLEAQVFDWVGRQGPQQDVVGASLASRMRCFARPSWTTRCR